MSKEAGEHVQQHMYLRNMNLKEAWPDDDRKPEYLIKGLKLHNGALLTVDAILIRSLPDRTQFRQEAH